MKRYCPTCRREYEDMSLNFCLEDGIALENADLEAETFRLDADYCTKPMGRANVDPEIAEMELNS